ncbi:hypothetical protein B0H63DRAFT_267268 [Podospora didyma]|uniref:Uncharacterized protein n=1 Tax=Podospora didyma TaxID=330526 RepID=A0AAE0NA61_9PEZI|nr:hypothetical protein B0H63DRAFT_267268 [Podospora didyma]
MESSFTDFEKRFVLAEMIKASNMDVAVLVDFIKLHQIQPNWLAMQLPGGRNMNQCLYAAETMFNMQIPPPAIQPLKRKSLGDLGDHIPKKLAAIHPTLGDTAPYAVPRNFGLQPAGAVQPVSIQPRPAGYTPIAQAPNPPSSGPTPSSAPPAGRRRGRPPKVDATRQNPPQMIAYQPITPAPIAPSPGPQNIAPQPRSPGPSQAPGGHALYQIQTTSIPELKPKRKGRPSAVDKQSLPETPPGTAGGPSSSETCSRPSDGPATKYQDWREIAPRREHDANSGPIPREPPLPSMNSPLPPSRNLHAALGVGTHVRETTSTTLEQQARQGGHTAVVN